MGERPAAAIFGAPKLQMEISRTLLSADSLLYDSQDAVGDSTSLGKPLVHKCQAGRK